MSGWTRKKRFWSCDKVQFIYLFGGLHCFQHCIGHITRCSFVGRGNQYIQLVMVLYCKLPTIGKQAWGEYKYLYLITNFQVLVLDS